MVSARLWSVLGYLPFTWCVECTGLHMKVTLSCRLSSRADWKYCCFCVSLSAAPSFNGQEKWDRCQKLGRAVWCLTWSAAHGRTSSYCLSAECPQRAPKTHMLAEFNVPSVITYLNFFYSCGTWKSTDFCNGRGPGLSVWKGPRRSCQSAVIFAHLLCRYHREFRGA